MRRVLAVSSGLLGAIVLYSTLRVIAAIWGHEPNPTTLLYSMHTAYFWRSLTSIHGGAMIAALVWILAENDEESVLRSIHAALVPCVLAIVLQSALVP